MGSLRFTDLQTHPTEVLDLTTLTVEEFQHLVPPFETAFQDHMAHWRLDGQPRIARWYTTYQNCPLATPEDRLLFILVYLKSYPLQVVQGRLFGMGQSKAHQWIHVLLTVLQAALCALGDAPTRSVTELANRIGVAEGKRPRWWHRGRGRRRCPIPPHPYPPHPFWPRWHRAAH